MSETNCSNCRYSILRESDNNFFGCNRPGKLYNLCMLNSCWKLKENKNCENCGWNVSEDSIIECKNSDVWTENKTNTDIDMCWKPKEKEMEKIQMTEEQFFNLLIDTCDEATRISNKKNKFKILSMSDRAIIFAKEKGYIKKSDLEITEENYNVMFEKVKNQMGEFAMYPEYHIFITELKKEITRLKEIIENGDK